MILSVLPYGTVDAWWEAVFECGVFVLTWVWMVEAFMRGDWQLRRLLVVLPMVVITLYAFIQSRLITLDHYQTYLTARKTLALTLFLGLLILHTSSTRRFRWLVHVVIAIGAGSALFALIRQGLQPADATSAFVLTFLYYGVGYGQFISANVFAYLMEMVFGLIAGLLLGGGVRRNGIAIHLAAGVIVWAALVFSNSRGGLLGMACAAVFLAFVALSWYARKRSGFEPDAAWLSFIRTSVLARVVVAVLILAMLVGGVVWMGGESLALKSEKQNVSQDIDGSTRKEIWRSSWNLIKSNSITGVGFGTLFLALPQYEVASGRLKVEQAHNDYLDLAANGGLIAVLLGLWFIGIVIWRARLSLRSADPYRRAAALGAAAGLIAVAVHSFVDFGLQVTGIAVICAGLVVIATVGRRLDTVIAVDGRPLRNRGPRSEHHG